MTEEWLAAHRRWLFVASAALFALAIGTGLYARYVGALPGEHQAMAWFYRTNGKEMITETTGFFIGTAAPPIVVGTCAALMWVVARHLGAGYAWLVPATVAAPAIALLAKH